MATLLDVGVLLNVGNLKIYDEEVEKTDKNQAKEPFLSKIKKINNFMVDNT